MVSPEALKEAEGDPFLGAIVADRFAILSRLGSGSMGMVYRARHEVMGRDVAIKILRTDRALDSQAKARFTREARAMSLLTSEYTVTVFDFGETPDPGLSEEVGEPVASLYLAMELLDGQSLGDRLKRVKRLPADEAIHITKQALRSLGEAHDKGVIHRDLKPDNLFLAKREDSDEEVCKVLDFGIAKVLHEQPGNVDALETQAGTVFGTPRFMSPEQAQAKSLDARSDLYSLGVLLYQMLVGRAPFVDDDAVVVMAHHIKTIPTPPHEAAPRVKMPRGLSELVSRVLSKQPSDRPSSAKAFIDELDQLSNAPAIADEDTADSSATATEELAALAQSDSDRPAPASAPGLGRVQLGAVMGTALAVLVAGFVALEPFESARALSAQRGVAASAIARMAAADAAMRAARAAPPVEDDAKPPLDAERANAADGAGSAAPTSDAPKPSGTAQAVEPAARAAPPTPKKKYTRFE